MKNLFVILFVMFTMTINAQDVKTHIVQRGETIESIAEKYNVSAIDITKANPDAAKFFYKGMKLKIPTASTKQPVNNQTVATPPVYTNTDKEPKKTGTIENYIELKKTKQKDGANLSEMSEGSFNFIVDVFGGYSNFRCDNVSPKSGIGFGADAGMQCDFSRLWSKIPDGFFGEVTLGYSYRGSGAYPIHYAGARILPIGYRYCLNSEFSIIGKAGMYVAYPFSKIKTKYKSYKTSLDYGLSVGVGVEWKKIGLLASYEHGFADVKDGGMVKLYNQGVFLTFSYIIKTF